MESQLAKSEQERYYLASQWQLMWRKLRRHKLATVSGAVLLVLYIVAFGAEFFAPYETLERHKEHIFAPPQKIHFLHRDRFYPRPFVYRLEPTRDPVTLRTIYAEDTTHPHPIRFFTHGFRYRLFGLFETDLHFLGVDEGEKLFLFGTDSLGRDLFSRNVFAARISMSIGLLGVALSFFLGCIMGGISGYYGGFVDNIIQRSIEFLLALPTIPVWMSLSAAVPPTWPSTRVYFAVTLLLSLRGWCGLARVVRGRLLELREQDFVMAARVAGAPPVDVIRRHLLPSFLSHLIVSVTLSVPGMILGETALSFLGLGIRPPAVSWGTLLQNAQNVRTISLHPWLLLPALFVIVVVLSYNLLGDGLRDAADPYK